MVTIITENRIPPYGRAYWEKYTKSCFDRYFVTEVSIVREYAGAVTSRLKGGPGGRFWSVCGISGRVFGPVMGQAAVTFTAALPSNSQ